MHVVGLEIRVVRATLVNELKDNASFKSAHVQKPYVTKSSGLVYTCMCMYQACSQAFSVAFTLQV